MRISLVSMPWAPFDLPPHSLGALAAWMARERPQHPVALHLPYLDFWEGFPEHYENLSRDSLAELVFQPLVFPEGKERVRAEFAVFVNKLRQAGVPVPADADGVFETLQVLALRVVRSLAPRLVEEADLVGMTVTYSQLFSSLALAREVKRLRPQLPIVFGGACVDDLVGAAVLEHLPWVDWTVQGEGELPLRALVDALSSGASTEGIAGLRGRGAGSSCDDAPVPDLDALPVPDFSAYAARADASAIFWHLLVEGARGCWWNRARETGNPRRGCYFCRYNLATYREKTPARVVREVGELSRTHRNVRFRFSDNAMRRHGLEDLAAGLEGIPADLRFFCEVRASITPRQVLALWQAGCHVLQIGVEGLSTAYLRRIGKGATTLQNLQVMKTCQELGIRSVSNLLTHFPGTPQQEVDQMAATILESALGFEPLRLSRFTLYRGSAVAHEPQAFRARILGDRQALVAGLPPELQGRLHVGILDYEEEEPADWSPVLRAVEAWRTLHATAPADSSFSPLLHYYTDGEDFLEIVDRRGEFKLVQLDAHWRHIYLYCMEIRREAQVLDRFGPAYGREVVLEALDAMAQERHMAREGGRCLSLAVASSPRVAARRILRS